MPKAPIQHTEVGLDQVEVVVDGDTATVGPVIFMTPGEETPYMFEMKKESDGRWRAVYGEWFSRIRRKISTRMHRRPVPCGSKILSDPSRPGYHFVIPEGLGMPFDPNGAIYWKGRYHLFYIFQDKRSGRRDHHWGHVSSTDLFHWRHHPTGLVSGMFSGNCFINGWPFPRCATTR